MRITGIEIKNFRSIRDLKIEGIAPITGIWGHNGAGKSAILQAMVVLTNVYAGKGGNINNCLNVGRIELGGLNDVFYQHNPCEISINLKFDDETAVSYFFGEKSGGKSSPTPKPNPLAQVRYYPPYRMWTSRKSPIATVIKENFLHNEKNIHGHIHWLVHETNKEKIRTGSETLLDRINMWASKFGLGDIDEETFQNKEASAFFHDSKMGIEVPIIDGGFGGKSFLFMILECLSYTDGIILIEEPEISLHPGAQSEALDFFVEMANEQNHQIIFTSHSEYLLRKIVRYYSEGKVDNEMVSVLYAEKTSKGTKVEKQNLDKLAKGYEEDQCGQFDLIYKLQRRS